MMSKSTKVTNCYSNQMIGRPEWYDDTVLVNLLMVTKGNERLDD